MWTSNIRRLDVELPAHVPVGHPATAISTSQLVAIDGQEESI
jgi:hypothetical protein